MPLLTAKTKMWLTVIVATLSPIGTAFYTHSGSWTGSQLVGTLIGGIVSLGLALLGYKSVPPQS